MRGGGRRPYLERLTWQEDKRDYEKSLYDFMRVGWDHACIPEPFKPNWHLEMICDHLEALSNRQIMRLLINVPPGHGKSLGVQVFWPAWTWAQNTTVDEQTTGLWTPQIDKPAVREHTWLGPGVRFAFVSHRQDLSIDHSIKCRRLIESDWYRSRWGERVLFARDENKASAYANMSGGSRQVAVMGSMTGIGAEAIVIDDPHDAMNVDSEVQRQEVIKFWTEQVTGRLRHDEGVLVIVMQRLHSRDLSGYVLAEQLGAKVLEVVANEPRRAWTHLCLPARYEPDHPFRSVTTVLRKSTGEQWKDLRTIEGAPLWENKYPARALDAREMGMSEYAVAGQLQQRPVARSGGLFKPHWFDDKIIDDPTAIPSATKWVRHWDLAATAKKGADYTVGLKLGKMPNGQFVVAHLVRVQEEGPAVSDLILRTAHTDGRDCIISLPQDPGQAGKVQKGDYARRLAGYIVQIESESSLGSKLKRADPVATQASHGNLYLLRAPWTQTLLDEMCLFPAAPHDDQVDSLSGAFARFVLPIGEHSSGPLRGLT